MKKTSKKKIKAYLSDRAFMLDYAKRHNISMEIIMIMKKNMDETQAGLLIDEICRNGKITDSICSSILA